MACKTLQQNLKELAIQFAPLFANKTIAEMEVKNEFINLSSDPSVKLSLIELMKLSNKEVIDITITSNGNNPTQMKFTSNSFSAHFVKLGVDPKSGKVKLLNVVTTGDNGKVISPKTARSQMLGGVVGGIGMALTEQVQIDHTTGQIMNASFGTYQVPLHSMVPPIDVWFVDKPDYNVNPIGAKGLGEIALIGFAAAVANAVYNATGKRVRDLPITPEKINSKKV
jgi:xanthine dehydrogenase YagR molybdenum-binding subunit